MLSLFVGGCASFEVANPKAINDIETDSRVLRTITLDNWEASLFMECSFDYSEVNYRISHDDDHRFSLREAVTSLSHLPNRMYERLNYKDFKATLDKIYLVSLSEKRSTIGGQYSSLSLSSIDAESFIKKCNQKHKEHQEVQNELARENKRKQELFIERTESELELKHLSIPNHKSYRYSFDDIYYEFQKSGYSNKVNTFAWVDNTSQYQVQQVINGGFLLTNRHYMDLPPIFILTDRELLEGQVWRSDNPVKFVKITTYQTVTGATKQALVFKELN